jgi:cysteine desulfurase/selenocysteine lyase
MNYPIEDIRNDFPILNQLVHGKPLVYFDNGATAHKPIQVVKAMEKVAFEYNSNIHRGVHHLSNTCTDAFEKSRQTVADFIGAPHSHEVIFTRGTTESINMVAFSFGETFLKQGDEIVISGMEHHSNIVPWQLLQKRKGIILKVIPVLDDGALDMETFKSLLTTRTKLVSVTHVSNVLGTINPIAEIIETAHKQNIPVLIDGAQAIQHLEIDVAKLDCDFYAFSGHKLYGPTGIGVLFGKEKWLNQMEPYQGGGEMIKSVSFEETTFNELPYKFEAGTPDFTGAIGLAAAIEYIKNIGQAEIKTHEDHLYAYAFEALGGFIDNFPNRWVGTGLRFLVFPLGRWERPPGDRLGHRVAQLLLAPSEARDRLTQGIYTSAAHGHPVGVMEAALPRVIAAEPLERRLHKAARSEGLDALTWDGRLQQALEQGLVDEAEAAELRTVRQLVQEIIAVDEFDPAELVAGQASQPPMRQSNAA